MMTRHTITTATDAKNYYQASDYYHEGESQETVGHWFGDTAERVGLEGKVTKEAFDRVCDNLHPSGNGQSLTPRTDDDRKIGEDFTFAGPKSFSVVEALAPAEERKRLQKAFDDAVMETVLQDMEPDMQTRLRKGGMDEDLLTGTALGAYYDHWTARPEGGMPPDPHRHKHVIFFNATFNPQENRVKAAQFGTLVRDKGYYQAAFFARLAHRLEGLGYPIDRRADGKWEIAGVLQSIIDKFSKRTQRIEFETEKRGITDPGEKAELGGKTRSKKQKGLTRPQLRQEWDSQLTAAERQALDSVFRKEIAPSEDVTASQAVTFAIAHCSEQQSAVPERELMRVALLHGLGHVTPKAIAAELPLHGVIVRDIDGRRIATTEGLQREEHFITGFAADGRGTVQPVGVPEGLTRTLKSGERLNDGQWDVVTGLLNSSNRVNLFQGPGGAGKSWSLSKFDEAMRRQGEAVTYLAVSTGAVEVLAKEGFDAKTVAHFLLDEKMQEAARGSRVVVDESSLLGHRAAYRLFRLAEKLDLKLILVGDPMQHGSVDRGALMRILREYGGITPFRLTEIMRQENADYRAAAKLLSEGQTLEGFDAIDGMGWVKQMMSEEDRYRHMAADYVQAVADKKSVLVISPTHAEAGRITQEIRSQLRDAGTLGTEEREFTRLVAVNASEAERGVATSYRPGDVLQFHQNAKGFKKGDRLTVSDPASLPLTQASKFSLYRPEAIRLAAGDKIRFTATVKAGSHKLANGATHAVAGFTPGGDIRLENGWVVPASAGHFRSGFVETSFGSQGKTVQRVILGMAADSLPATNQEQMYVSSSRARERMTLYTDDKAAVRQAVQRSSQKLAALDLLPPKPEVRPKRWDRWQNHLARLRRLRVIDRTRAAWQAAIQKPLSLQHERQVGYGR
jgi:conjugative relaxase-like TrwC/TraI family protein